MKSAKDVAELLISCISSGSEGGPLPSSIHSQRGTSISCQYTFPLLPLIKGLRSPKLLWQVPVTCSTRRRGWVGKGVAHQVLECSLLTCTGSCKPLFMASPSHILDESMAKRPGSKLGAPVHTLGNPAGGLLTPHITKGTKGTKEKMGLFCFSFKVCTCSNAPDESHKSLVPIKYILPCLLNVLHASGTSHILLKQELFLFWVHRTRLLE